jgi:hypothetical protein
MRKAAAGGEGMGDCIFTEDHSDLPEDLIKQLSRRYKIAAGLITSPAALRTSIVPRVPVNKKIRTKGMPMKEFRKSLVANKPQEPPHA